jgi:ATP-binding cassette subfamily B protein
MIKGTHRLATIKNADRILVITKEGIIEQGTHKELIE